MPAGREREQRRERRDTPLHRVLGWWGSSQPLATEVLRLVSPGRVMVRDHGEPLAEEGPRLRVEVRIHREEDEVLPVGPDSRRGLAEGLWWEAAPTAYHPAEHWDQVGAGRPVGFGWLAEGRHWVALPELEDRTLILRGRDLPVESVELVRVLDLEPYIEGQRRLEAAWARHYDQEH